MEAVLEALSPEPLDELEELDPSELLPDESEALDEPDDELEPDDVDDEPDRLSVL